MTLELEEAIKLRLLNRSFTTKEDLKTLIALSCPRAVIQKLSDDTDVFFIHVDAEYVPVITSVQQKLPLDILIKAKVLDSLSDFTGYVWLE